MLYIIISFVIIGAMVISIIKNNKSVHLEIQSGDSEEPEIEYTTADSFWKTLCVMSAVVNFFLIFWSTFYVNQLDFDFKDSSYVKIEYVYDEPLSYELEIIPGSENEYTRYNVYDKHENGYSYCIKNQDGNYILKDTCNGYFNEVEFVYTDKVQPHLTIQGGREVTTLIKKPSFWFHLFKWWEVKDCAIGDAVQELRLVETYTFYLPPIK